MLPPWVKLLTTSRPEADIEACFERFRPTVIDADDIRHQEDLRVYIRTQLQDYLLLPAGTGEEQQAVTMAAAVDILMRKSEGRFVYMSLVARDLFVDKQKKYTLETLEAVLPKGLDEVYLASFERIRNAGVKRYKQSVWPLVCMLVSMVEPLKVSDAQMLMGCSKEEMEALAGLLSGMFPAVGGEGKSSRCFTLFHKTVADWLLDERKSRKAAVENELTLYCLQELFVEANVSKVKEYMSCLEQEDLCSFESLEDMCGNDVEWQSCLPSLPTVAKVKIRNYVKSRSCAEGGREGGVGSRQKEMWYDFFVGAQHGHVVYSERMLDLVGLSSDDFRGCLCLAPLQLEAALSCSYLLNHIVQHLVDAGQVEAAQSLLLQLPWLLICLQHRRRGVWDVLNDMRYALRVGGTDCVKKHKTGSAGDHENEEVSLLISSLFRSLQLLEQGTSMSVSSIASCKDEEDITMVFVLYARGRLHEVGKQNNKRLLLPLQHLLESCEEWLKREKHIVPVNLNLEGPGGPLLGTLQGHDAYVTSVCISPDGSRIVSGSWDKTIKIWDASSGECVQTLRGHDNRVTSVCISPDGSRIVSGSWDETIKIWDASSGECVQTLRGHDNRVTSVCISPDGSRIVSGS
ncbi:WD40 repeat domain-containing protein, partial [archaeon]